MNSKNHRPISDVGYLTSRFTPQVLQFRHHSSPATSRLAGLIAILLTMGALYLWATPAQADDPSFNTTIVLGSGTYSTNSLAVGDVNGDGTLDVVAGRNGQDVVYLNDGAGNFPTAIDFGGLGGSSESVALGDLNGDGALDLVVGAYGQNVTYLNDGTGHFPTTIPFGSGSDITYSVALGDVNGDGALDVVVGNDGQNAVYLNDGEGNFPTIINFGPATSLTESVAVGDLNGDGMLDLIVGGGQDVVYLNDGEGNFPTAIDFSTGTGRVVVADLNGDGALDLVAGNEVGYNKVYLNDGAGNFPTVINFGSGRDFTRNVAVGDVNGDGALDLVVGNFVEQDAVYLNDGAGSFPTAIDFGPNNYATHGLAVGDLNGDGALDLIAGSGPDVVYLNDGAGNFPTVINFGPATSLTESVAVGDVNGDGALDLVVGNSVEQDAVYLNDGTGSFPTAIDFGPNYYATHGLAMGDLNSDGALDLVVGRGGQDVVYLNDGAGNFPGIINFGPATSLTESVALGDVNGDGALDLVVARDGQDVVYLNDGAGSFLTAIDFGPNNYATHGLAVGDLNGDGALDLVVGAYGQNVTYLNDGTGHFPATIPFSPGSDNTYGVAVGDMNDDGMLDLVVGNYRGQNAVYLNDGAGGFPTAINFGPGMDDTMSVAVGDLNSDGALDVVAGNENQQNVLYLNDGTGHLPTVINFGPATNRTYSVALGDVNGDGALDVIVGSRGRQNKVHLNGIGLASDLANSPLSLTVTRPITTGNANFYSTPVLLDSQNIPITYTLFDPEGDRIGRVTALYSMDGGGYWKEAVPTGTTTSHLTLGTALAFDGVDDYVRVEGSADLNIAGPLTIEAWVRVGRFDRTWQAIVTKGDSAYRLHRYQDSNTVSFDTSGLSNVALVATTPITDGRWHHIAAVYDGSTKCIYIDGVEENAISVTGSLQVNSYDLAIGENLQAPGRFFKGKIDEVRIWNVARSEQEIRTNMYRTLTGNEAGLAAYWTFDEGSGATAFDRTSNSYDGSLMGEVTGQGPRWVGDPFATYTYTWDTFASGFFGQSDNVVIRMVAYPQPLSSTLALTGTYRYTNTVAGPYQRPYVSATTFPFRVRGTQVRVVDEASKGVPNALVYRLPVNQRVGGFAMGSTITTPFRTNPHGYLQGRGQLRRGDRLLALAPVELPVTFTQRYSDSLRLYYTNGTPTEAGLDTWISNTSSPTVTRAGVQQLTVSPEHPLILFDIDVSLEWDAENDLDYLIQLEDDLKQASAYLYDFTDGQVALGRVRVFQNAKKWAYSHVVVRASNRLRPFAVQGGIVVTSTVDPHHALPDDYIEYNIGQIRMGATWNRYGVPGQNLGEDWALALAHELAHYLLFQDDTYLGLNDENLLIPIGTCDGSAMGDVYDPDNTEFVYDQARWNDNCGQTLAERTLGRTEWATNELWYPWLHRPTQENSGPSSMPFEFTNVEIVPIVTPTETLDDPTFTINYQEGSRSSSEARAYLLRDWNDEVGYDTVFELGSPATGQNRVLARGARPGDRLCVFDGARGQSGCEVIQVGDSELDMEPDGDWAPLIQLTPVNSSTLMLQVTGVPAGISHLEARLFREYGAVLAFPDLPEVEAGVYRATFELPYPALSGHVQVWTPTEPRHEVIVAYAIGGNLGSGPFDRGGGPFDRGGGPFDRGGGPFDRGGGPADRGLGAPLVSPDGQMIFFSADPGVFQEGELYTVQNAAHLPSLPDGRKALGQGYSLVASPNVTRVISGSISFQYLGLDADVERVDEDTLTIHFWDGAEWRALETVRSPYFNLASAQSQGSGVYALLAGVITPEITDYTPSVVFNDEATTLVMTGTNFLEPVRVLLVGTEPITLPAQLISEKMIVTEIPSGLAAGEYGLEVLNDGGGRASAPGTLSVFEPTTACFYDDFESGPNQWERDGDWDIVTIQGEDVRAMTDSPTTPYKSAGDYGTGLKTYTTAIASPVIDLAECYSPTLTFRHDYVIDNRPPSQDVGRLEISTDGGATWTELARYASGDVPEDEDLVSQDESPEWAGADWERVEISLNPYSGPVRLRFSLEVDEDYSAKGWVIDDVIISSGAGPQPGDFNIFLPVILKKE